MIGKVAQRREERVAEIVAAAWTLAREHGIGGVTLHALAREIGIRQPSLYAYFDSKNALYDAMFADGNRQLLGRIDALVLPRSPRAAVKVFMRTLVEFAVEDPARHALLFLRQLPGFEPSPSSRSRSRIQRGASCSSSATSLASLLRLSHTRSRRRRWGAPPR